MINSQFAHLSVIWKICEVGHASCSGVDEEKPFYCTVVPNPEFHHLHMLSFCVATRIGIGTIHIALRLVLIMFISFAMLIK